MQILGIGVDIVSNLRIKKSIKKNSFINRVFSKSEIYHSKKTINKSNYFSKRFAAKEAFMKALGTGFRYNVNFKDISVINNKEGKPELKVTSNIKKLLINRLKVKKFNLFISLSDEKNYSIAFVVIQKK
jgi:holo-[acyl-carrier protein] synthase